MDVVLDALGAAVLQRPGRSLDGVGDHHDRSLLGARLGAGITEVILANLEALLERLPVEVPLDRGPLVLLNDLADDRRKMVLPEQLDAFGDMRVQDVRAGRRRQILVDIADVRLVLDEEMRTADLADIVEIAADP